MARNTPQRYGGGLLGANPGRLWGVDVRAVVQRCLGASVDVGGADIVGSFEGPGLAVLVAATHSDGPQQVERMASKLWGLRLFDADALAGTQVCIPPQGPRELSCSDLGLPLLVISQFSLYGRTAKGRRPTWEDAAPAAIAEPLVDALVERLRDLGARVETGRFGADMRVRLTNNGPLTVIVDT